MSHPFFIKYFTYLIRRIFVVKFKDQNVFIKIPFPITILSMMIDVNLTITVTKKKTRHLIIHQLDFYLLDINMYGSVVRLNSIR